MSCNTCHHNILYGDIDKHPKFALTNGWVIGELPKSVIHKDIDNILESLVARYRIFAMFTLIIQVLIKQLRAIVVFS